MPLLQDPFQKTTDHDDVKDEKFDNKEAYERIMKNGHRKNLTKSFIASRGPYCAKRLKYVTHAELIEHNRLRAEQKLSEFKSNISRR
jgi:hypothetical protein